MHKETDAGPRLVPSVATRSVQREFHCYCRVERSDLSLGLYAPKVRYKQVKPRFLRALWNIHSCNIQLEPSGSNWNIALVHNALGTVV